MDVMVDVGVRELRDGLSRFLARVKNGETITVTEHGKPIARIEPTRGSTLAELIAQGRVTAATRPKGALPPPLKLTDGPSLSEIVIEQRG